MINEISVPQVIALNLADVERRCIERERRKHLEALLDDIPMDDPPDTHVDEDDYWLSVPDDRYWDDDDDQD